MTAAPKPRGAVVVVTGAAGRIGRCLVAALEAAGATVVGLDDALALGLGYGIARATRLPERSARAMTFEVGVRNSGLGLLLVFSYFSGLGGMALVAAWWGIWDIVAALAVARWWRRRSPRDEPRPAGGPALVSADGGAGSGSRPPAG